MKATSYALAATAIDALPGDVRKERRRRRIGLRVAAAEMGLSRQAVWLLEHGHDCRTSTTRTALDWLARGGAK